MSRRGRGEGSLWPRKDGRWEGRVQLGWSPEGRRLYRSVIAPSQAEAVRRLADLRRQLAAGLPATDQRLTVTAYLARWLDDAAPRLRPSTLTRYAGLVRGQLVPKLGRLKLHALAPSDVARMMAAVQADGLSPRTAGHCRAVLRCALADAERDGLVGRNVARLADAPRVPAPTPTVLEPAEVWAVLDACTEPGLRRLATVAITTGLRLGEQLGLRWADVDTERRCLTVRTTLQRTAGAYSLGEPKSTASRRVVPLTDSALEALHQERQAQLAAQLAAGSRWRQPIPGLVFTTATGAPRNGNAVTHSFQDALAAAGLSRLRWHDLRAAHGALMLAEGADISVVSRKLGHSSVSLTARHYGGVADSLQRAAADRLGLALQRPV
jgi:integrase